MIKIFINRVINETLRFIESAQAESRVIIRCHKLIIPTFIDFHFPPFSLLSVVYEICYVLCVHFPETLYLYVCTHSAKKISIISLIEHALVLFHYETFFLPFCTYSHKRNVSGEVTRSFRPCPSGFCFQAAQKVDEISIATKAARHNRVEREGTNLRASRISHKAQPVSCSCFTIACTSRFRCYMKFLLSLYWLFVWENYVNDAISSFVLSRRFV